MHSVEAKLGPRVFVVDDDGSVRKALGRLIASAGHEVLSFGSAAEFCEAVPAGTPGVLVLDLRMPEMDGFELQRRLTERRSPLAVILITAFAQPGDREEALRSGAVGFLVKPFEDMALLGLIDAALQR
jgi:FixJ family two-component response regulator